MLLAFAFTACAGGPGSTAIDDLRGSWRIAGVDVPAGARMPTINLGADGSISGNAGVNRYRATVDAAQLASGRWQMTPISVTRMAGTAEAMALEQSFLEALSSVDTVAVADGFMQLRRGEQVLVQLERMSWR